MITINKTQSKHGS